LEKQISVGRFFGKDLVLKNKDKSNFGTQKQFGLNRKSVFINRRDCLFGNRASSALNVRSSAQKTLASHTFIDIFQTQLRFELASVNSSRFGFARTF
jgi:hypothetical protein